MNKLIALAVLAALCLICAGGFSLIFEFGNSREPTAISIADLEGNPPFNRNIIITGAQLLSDEGLRVWKTRSFNKVAGSEVLLIPLADIRLARLQSFAPSVVLLIREPEIKEISDHRLFDSGHIPAVRVTKWSLESIAERKLTERYGATAVERMLVVEYKRKVTGMSEPLIQILVGVFLITGLVLYGIQSSGTASGTTPPRIYT